MTELEKLKQMSFRDKVWYIWEYYKFHIFGILGILLVLYVVGTSIYRSTFDTVFSCVYINNRSEQELNTDIVTKDFREHLGLSDKQLISTESMYISYGNDATEFSYASMAKISALVASKELDVMICDQENFEHYASLDGFNNLETTLPEDVLAMVQDRIVYGDTGNGTSIPCGIDLTGTAFAEQSNLAMEPAILGIVGNSTHIDYVSEFLRYIFSL